MRERYVINTRKYIVAQINTISPTYKKFKSSWRPISKKYVVDHRGRTCLE